MGNTLFRCRGSYFDKKHSELIEVHKALNEAYSMASSLYEEICGGGAWAGDSQKAMLAYVDLLLQYHAKLATEADPPSPLQAAIDTLQVLLDDLDNFYDNAECYREIMRIS